MISNRWKLAIAALPIIGTCVLAQPQPGGLGGFFQAWWGVSRIPDPYELLDPTAYWYPSKDLNNADRILGIASTNTVNAASTTTNGWEFNGTSQYLDMGRPLEIEINTNLQYSMAAWVYKFTNPDATRGIMGKSFAGPGDRWFIGGVSGGFRAVIDEGGGSATSGNQTFSSGIWYHVVGIFDRSQIIGIKLYVDGINTHTANFTDSDPITYDGNIDVPFRFGSHNSAAGAPASYWNGYIDQAAVWNGRALTSNEVFQLFEDTKEGRK